MAEEEQNLVEICDEDGNVTQCEVYDIVEYNDKTYALLYPLDEENEEEPELIVFEYVEEGDECYFQNIDDQEEFDAVCDYIQSLDFEDEEDIIDEE
ncbi:MAG: DUF1292 domain-containing protein [bacterium]|nr:DUF1292 domain-containing protein [bacterium]